MSNQTGANKLENRFYCEEGCGKWTPLKETDSDGNENTLASWNCGCWIDKPSDKDCHKCNRNLTGGEKKTCYGRSHSSDENNIEFVCDYCYLGNEIPNNSSHDSIMENNLRNMEDTLRRAEENRNWQYREREREQFV